MIVNLHIVNGGLFSISNSHLDIITSSREINTPLDGITNHIWIGLGTPGGGFVRREEYEVGEKGISLAHSTSSIFSHISAPTIGESIVILEGSSIIDFPSFRTFLFRGKANLDFHGRVRHRLGRFFVTVSVLDMLTAIVEDSWVREVNVIGSGFGVAIFQDFNIKD